MSTLKRKFWQESLLASIDRLREVQLWFPLPCLISYFLVLLLIGHLLLGLNPRLGNHASLLPFDAKKSDEGAIWIAASLSNDQIIVTTSTRKVFKINSNKPSSQSIKNLTDYLKKETENVLITAAISRKISHIQSILVIAVDQQMTMRHLRPILYAMAEAGISEYAFETKIPPKEKI